MPKSDLDQANRLMLLALANRLNERSNQLFIAIQAIFLIADDKIKAPLRQIQRTQPDWAADLSQLKVIAQALGEDAIDAIWRDPSPQFRLDRSYRCILEADETIGEVRLIKQPEIGQLITVGDFRVRVKSFAVMPNGGPKDLDVQVDLA